MNDESGESMELPLTRLGESELTRLVRADGEKPEVDSRNEGS